MPGCVSTTKWLLERTQIYIYIYIYRVSQNLCHKILLAIPHP